MTEVLQPITVSSSEAGSARTTIISPGAVPVSAPMARSVDDYTPEEIAKLIQTHQLMTREMQNLDEVMRTLDQQVGEYERELNDFERTKERVIEEHRAANIQALDGKEREIEKAKQKLAALEKELQEVEINCDNANAEVYRYVINDVYDGIHVGFWR
jgi:predicted RNase H-like nuclease (RuvC/YqgF family)